ncbi:MAG: retroviral-like aspartic protease family protein [Burkholderiales bacterium]|nr:retroviral-like aspartic protease family protein [Burkholderiales bacterium]
MSKRIVAAALAALLGGAVQAQTVALQGMLGSKALLIVNGGAPRSVAPGESHEGVKVLSTLGDQAMLEVGGKRFTLRVGDSPASVGGGPAPARGNRLVFTMDSGGHFMPRGSINGRSVQFLVDTGATSVSLSKEDADRIGVKYEATGRPVMLHTANGNVRGWLVKLDSVRINDVEIYGVEAVVSPAGMPHVLLGNSFLSRFQMKRENDIMVLERRY